MAIYTVHLPAAGPRPAPRDDVALAAESFCWAAFLFGPVWLAARRLWIWLALWLVLAGVFVLFAIFLAGAVATAALVAVVVLAQALLGFEANDLRRRALERSGRAAITIVSARSANAAAGRFFRRQLRLRDAAGRGEPASEQPAPRRDPGFLTLFPDERAP